MVEITVIVAAISVLGMVACGVAAYFLDRDETQTVDADRDLLVRADRLFPYVGLGLAALMFAVVAGVVII